MTVIALRGENAAVTTEFRDDDNNLIDAGTVSYLVLDPNGTQVANGTSTTLIAGRYRLDYLIPGNAAFGYYIARFTPSTSTPARDEPFEVAALTPQQQKDMITIVRLRTGERIPTGGADTDTMFTDDEILALYLNYASTPRTVLELLRAKAANWAALIDVEESGSRRTLSQRYKAISNLIDKYEAEVQAEQDAVAAAAGRIVGKPIDLRSCGSRNMTLLTADYGNYVAWRLVPSDYDWLNDPFIGASRGAYNI